MYSFPPLKFLILVPLSLRIFLNWSVVTVQCARSNRFSSVVTISRPPTSSSLKITNRSFQHAAPHLWNKLPHPHLGLSTSHRPIHTLDSHCHHHHFHHQSLLLFFTLDLKHTSSSSLFHHRLLHRYSLDWSHVLQAGPFSLAHRF